MKKLVLIAAIATLPIMGIAQNEAFRNPNLPEEDRITSLLKELTLEEKIACFSTRPTLPRLGIRIPAQKVQLLIGASSTDIRLRTTIQTTP